MNTIRLPAVPRTDRPVWGSTDWASQSCLADWSTLERQWLGTEERQAAQAAARRRLRKRFLVSFALAAVLAVATLPGLQGALLGVLRALGPALGWLADVLPFVALGGGVLVLAGVAVGLWRDPPAQETARAAQPDADGAG